MAIWLPPRSAMPGEAPLIQPPEARSPARTRTAQASSVSRWDAKLCRGKRQSLARAHRSKTGQFIYSKSGHFYLLLTWVRKALTRPPQRDRVSNDRGRFQLQEWTLTGPTAALTHNMELQHEEIDLPGDCDLGRMRYI